MSRIRSSWMIHLNEIINHKEIRAFVAKKERELFDAYYPIPKLETKLWLQNKIFKSSSPTTHNSLRCHHIIQGNICS
jgi:hypothetical protein